MCGPLEFKLEYITPGGLQTTLPSWITFDTSAADYIVVDGASCADAGIHQFTLTAFLTDDPSKELVLSEWLSVELICEENLYKVELDPEENKPYFEVGTNSSAPIIPDVVLYEGDVKFVVLPEIVDKGKDYPVHVELVGSTDVALIQDDTSKRYALRFKATWNREQSYEVEEEEQPTLLVKPINLILVDSKAHSNNYNFTLTVLKRESDHNETLSES